MRGPFERIEEDVIADVLRDSWGLEVETLDYHPEGGGAFHWIASTTDGRRWFVTCDDLDTKPWFGADRDSVFDALQDAYATAVGLRRAGLSFVVAAEPATSHAPAVRLDDRHSLSVFEHVDGEPGRWGQPLPRGTVEELVAILARLHLATPAPGGAAARGLDLPERARLEGVLDDLARPWDGGPLSESGRRLLARHADQVAVWLSDLDRLATTLADSGGPTVLTHGEPHPGNLIRADRGLVLVDWDTVAHARPERDLWMVTEAANGAGSQYEELTGFALDPEALRAYRTLWALSDIASFATLLHGPHGDEVDTARSLVGLERLLIGEDPSPFGPLAPGSPRGESNP